MTFGVDGNALAPADGNGRTYQWDMADGGLAGTFAHNIAGTYVIPGHHTVYGVTFGPRGTVGPRPTATARCACGM